jgi:hypothetical protein
MLLEKGIRPQVQEHPKDNQKAAQVPIREDYESHQRNGEVKADQQDDGC